MAAKDSLIELVDAFSNYLKSERTEEAQEESTVPDKAEPKKEDTRDYFVNKETGRLYHVYDETTGIYYLLGGSYVSISSWEQFRNGLSISGDVLDMISREIKDAHRAEVFNGYKPVEVFRINAFVNNMYDFIKEAKRVSNYYCEKTNFVPGLGTIRFKLTQEMIDVITNAKENGTALVLPNKIGGLVLPRSGSKA